MDRHRSGHLDPTRGESNFATFYRRHHARVWRTLSCLGVPDDELDDAVQDVFVVVYRRMGDPERYQSIKSWLYAVARRVAWRQRRTGARARNKLQQVAREPTPSQTPPDEAVARQQAVRFVRRFLDVLDEEQRTVFVLADIEGLTAPQIAEVVGAKVATVYSRLRLARRRFAQAVARQGARHRREAEHGG
jgi:RNA polymerase sigma-70 factor (ECF subfamily)